MNAARQRQIAAARVLADLIARDLPVASWQISGPADVLDIHLGHHGRDTDDERRADIAAWAEFFGAKVEVTEYDDHTKHQVNAEHEGVPVEVWAYTDRNFDYVKVTPAGGAR